MYPVQQFHREIDPVSYLPLVPSFGKQEGSRLEIKGAFLEPRGYSGRGHHWEAAAPAQGSAAHGCVVLGIISLWASVSS